MVISSDDAPNTAAAKETACGCARNYSAASVLELYVQVFDEEDALDRLEAFASPNGPRSTGCP